MRRRFNQRERFALYLSTDGKCAMCGCDLKEGWHADHIQPYSKGGETDVINGQPLCPECNLRKGASTPMELREWQKEQHDEFIKSTQKWFMILAVPGAGKTIAMLHNAHSAMQSGQADIILIVTPTKPLKKQWKRKARETFGYYIMEDFQGYLDTSAFHGAVVTYQQIAIDHKKVRALFRNHRVFVILDEPHHMGEDNTWGAKAKDALGEAVRGVMGTGTPFRGDNGYIPFVRYDQNNTVVSDYSYDYSDGLIDQVVRAIFFRKMDIDAKWVSYDNEIVKASYKDELDKRRARERLNVTIQADSEWMHDVLKQAIADIRHIRKHEQHDAGLLIITKDTRHASEVAALYQKLSGVKPIVVSSNEDHDGAEAIEAFANNDDECVISVAMISEGVDIPRLRSIVYATNVRTQLFFEQAIGRVWRVQRGHELANALCYIPSDPDLESFAEIIKAQRQYGIQDQDRNPRRRDDDIEISPPTEPRQTRLFGPELISLTAVPDGGIYLDVNYSQSELDAAEQWLKEKGYRISLEVAVQIWRNEIKNAQPHVEETPKDTYDPEKHLEDLRRTCSKLANRVARIRGIQPGDVHWDWMDNHDGTKQSRASIKELERKEAWLRSQIRRAA